MAAESQKEALIARIAASRAAVASEVATVRRRLDVKSRVKESFMAKPLAWFGGSLGAGFLASIVTKRRPRRAAKVVEKTARRSLWSLALGGAFALARPALQAWAADAVRKRLSVPASGGRRGMAKKPYLP